MGSLPRPAQEFSMRNPTFARTGVAAGLVFAALHAQALTTVDFTGYANGSETITYTLAAPNVVKVNTVGAGGFATILNGGASFTTYCIDLYQTLNFADPAYTTYSIVPGSLHAFANMNANADLGRLFGAGHIVNDAVTSAAFQIAVWEIAYEKTGTAYDVTSGSASFAGSGTGPTAALTLATSWLGTLGSNGVPITTLESPDHQDVVYATPVPEPETYALMMAGLGVVMFMGRRSRRQRG
jgi:hypothetical protein